MESLEIGQQSFHSNHAEEDRAKAIRDMFTSLEKGVGDSLKAPEIQAVHEMIRMGGLSQPQVLASMKYVCVDPEVCEDWELLDLLKEMDRRYYLVQDFRWEFSMLDSSGTDTINVDEAMWFLQTVHGEHFSRKNWENFIKSRPVPESKVSFAEIEVELCNIPCYMDVLEEEQAEKRQREELERKKQLQKEELRKAKIKQEEEKKKLLEQQEKILKEAEEKRQREEEKERRKLQKEEDERRKKAEEERLERVKQEEEERRRRAEEEAKNIEITAKDAAEAEAAAERAAQEAAEKLKRAENAKSKKELEEAEKEARQKQKEMKEKKIRANLKVAIKIRKRPALKKSVQDFKQAKLNDHDGDVPVAERLLKLAGAKDRLKNAISGRQLKDLDDSINYVKKNGFEQELQPLMIEANNLMLRLKRLERIRAEILELKQSTVAEIRSYQSPPLIVHSVMIGTFLILGHAESETKEWKKVQALVGKTGKEGLKRRCLEYDPANLVKNMDIANKAKEKMSAFELDDVRDVSAGAATFFLWASNMIEEADMIYSQNNQPTSNTENDDVI